MNPQVTILLPVYNGADTLADAINSIIAQTFTDWELLIIDDCSSDGSVDVMKTFKDSRISVIQQAKNGGLSATLNHGVSLAKGAYIMRMDQDDLCLPDRIATQVDYLEEHPETDLIGCLCLYFDDETFTPLGVITVSENHKELSASRFSRGYALAHPSLMGKISWFRKHKYCSEFDGVEDRELLMRASESSIYGCVQEVLLAYRVRRLSAKSSFKKRRLFIKAVATHGGIGVASLVVLREVILFLFDLLRLQPMRVRLKAGSAIDGQLKWEQILEKFGQR